MSDWCAPLLGARLRIDAALVRDSRVGKVRLNVLSRTNEGRWKMNGQLTHMDLCGFTIFEYNKLTDEYWGGSVGGSREYPVSFILVPRSALALPNDELGKRVRAYEILIEEAEASRVLEIVRQRGVSNASMEELTVWARTLSTFSQRDEFQEAIAAVNSRIQYLLSLTVRREQIRVERQSVRKQYNKLFMRLGREHGFQCAKCGSCHNLEIEHIVPLVNGGTSDYANLQLLCKNCNLTKGAETADYRSEAGQESYVS